IPVVTAGCRYQNGAGDSNAGAVSSVQMDNTIGMQLCIDHLRAREYRRIAHLAGPETQSDAHERREAYTRIIQEFQDPIVIDAAADPEHLKIGYQGAQRLWRRKGPKVDAIIAYDDMVAIGAM